MEDGIEIYKEKIGLASAGSAKPAATALGEVVLVSLSKGYFRLVHDVLELSRIHKFDWPGQHFNLANFFLQKSF